MRKKSWTSILSLLFTTFFFISCSTLPQLPNHLAFSNPQFLEEHTDKVLSVRFSLNEKWIASGSVDDTVLIWSVHDAQLVKELERHPDDVYSVSFSPDGRFIATGCRDNQVRVFSLADYSLKYLLKGHSDPVYWVAFSPDGEILASSSVDATIRLWSTQDGSLLKVFRDHSDTVNAIDFSPDGKYLVSGSTDNTVRIWSVSEMALIDTIKIGKKSPVFSVVFSPDGSFVAVATREDKPFDENEKIVYPIILYKFDNGNLTNLGKLLRHKSNVWALAFTHDSNYLISGGSDQRFNVWDVSSCSLLGSTKSLSGEIWGIDISPEGAYLALACSKNIVELYGPVN